jgi:hypothetical protein
MKKYLLFIYLCTVLCINQSCTQKPVVLKNAIVDATIEYQTIDGFGVNFNPDQWNGGKQKQAIDLLVDDLGSNQFRFDSYGRANWLDPLNRNADGHWPADYLDSIYTSPAWTDAWAAFKYLNSKGIIPYFNVSGIVPTEWNEPGTKILADFDAYSEMIVTMLDWARNKENLHFTHLAPYNETDFDGTREGPALPPQNRVKAVSSMIKKLNEHHLDDIKLIVFCDATFGNSKIEPFLKDSSFVPYITAFSGHTYGNGDEGEGSWYWEKSQLGFAKELIKKSPYRNAHIWINEFGDLDQTGEIEFEFAWRTTRRLLLELRSGANSGQFWDAFDNYHKHDSAWATYGLLHTDTVNWNYTPKARFYGLKQIFRFVKPNFIRIDISAPPVKEYDVYQQWNSELKNIKIYAFKSPDGKEITITGMNLVESDVKLNISIKGMSLEDGRKVNTYITTRHKNCEKSFTSKLEGNIISSTIPERSIFTISTLKAEN